MTSKTRPGQHGLAGRSNSTHVESIRDVERGNAIGSAAIKLSPEPSDDPNDPLNWPLWIKIAVLTQTSLLAAIGGLNTATINPALVQLAREFNISRIRASYQTTVCIALNGIAPWIWIPLAHRYGRRPIWLATTFLGFISILGCAFAKTYTQLIVARIFNGFFPVGFALGATTVVDLFYFHQRGRAMGFFTVTVVNGSHLAPIIGGLLGQFCGWRWIFKFLAIVDAVLLLVAVFCLPETMYTRKRRSAVETAGAQPQNLTVSRSTETTSESSSTNENTEVQISITKPVAEANALSMSPLSTPPLTPISTNEIPRKPTTKLERYRHALRLTTPDPSYRISFETSILPTLRLFKSPTALFPAIYYASMYGFASILPAVTVAAIFTEYFGWNTLTIGLSYGAALTIGGILGEAVSGWVCDTVVKREQRRLLHLQATQGHNNDHLTNTVKIRPEIRLRPIWTGAILTPIGLLVYGFTLQYHTHPALPLFGMGLSCFGLQIITTCTYTYSIDCHTDNNQVVAPVTPLHQQNQSPQASSSSTTLSPSPQNTTATIATTTHPPMNSPKRPNKKKEKATAAEVAQLFNIIRQTFGFTFAFYVIRLGHRIGYQYTFLLFAFCGGVLAFLPVLALIFRPRIFRDWFGMV